MSNRLTDLKVKASKVGRHVDADVRGLCLVVNQSGSRSWVLRIVTGGKRRDIGLGGYPDVLLEDARDVARQLRRVAAAGGDLIAERDKNKVVIPTFREAATACHESKKAGWTDRTADAFTSTLKLHVYPAIGRLRVDSVDANDIVQCLKPLWTDKPAAARKIKQWIGLVLDYAQGRGWRRSGMPRDGVRPQMSRQAKASNFASMPYPDVPAFVGAIEAKPTTVGRLALLFTILTAARSGETRSMKWSHLDLDAKLWRRPAPLMKQREAHIVTLSSAAVAVLKRTLTLRTTLVDCLVFQGTGDRPLSDMTLSKVLRDAKRPYTVHGFRSSFRTWAAEQCPTIPDSVAEAALAHAVPDAVERAYQRAKFIEMRHDLLERWANYVGGKSNVLRLVG